jgi:hypothetical protein
MPDRPAALPRTLATVAPLVLAGLALAGCGASAGVAGPDFRVDTLPSATSTLAIGRASQGFVDVTAVRVVQGGKGQPARIYLSARTTDGRPDVLDGIGANVAASVRLVSAAGGSVATLPVPAGGSLVLGPNGPRGLFPAAALEPGGTVALVLRFARAGTVNVFAHVTGS